MNRQEFDQAMTDLDKIVTSVLRERGPEIIANLNRVIALEQQFDHKYGPNWRAELNTPNEEDY